MPRSYLSRQRSQGDSRLAGVELVTVDRSVLVARELDRPDWAPGGIIFTGRTNGTSA
jgi:hypothetical protein